MHLNEITLSPYLLTQLYPSSLIEAEQKADPPLPVVDKKENTPAETTWKALGSNQKKVLIVVRYEGIAHLPDAELEFLTQLLKACRLGLNDVALINFANYHQEPYTHLLNHFEAKTVLLFGLTPEQFGFPFDSPAFQVQHFADYTIIYAPALEQLEGDKPAKGQLWTGLKKIFNL